MNRTATQWVIALIALGVLALIALPLLNPSQDEGQWSYSDLVAHAGAHHVKQVTITGTSAVATDTAGHSYHVTLPSNTDALAGALTADGVNVRFQGGDGITSFILGLVPTLLLLAAIVGLIWWSSRRLGGGANQAASFARSSARMISPERGHVTFADVAGEEEAEEELQEVVEFLRSPDKFSRLGARVPKGVLMIGPPGSGKTLLAKAVAGEARVPFFSISGSEFVEMFVGVGASRVRDLFEKAKRERPCIVFVDEIDAVGRQRGAGLGGGNDEREQTLNQLLVEMDGFDTDTRVIVIAATNRPDVLDPALLRPGRFDRHVTLDRPDVRGRRAILGVHARGKPMASDVDLEVVARETPGFCGADLANLVNESAILAARENRRAISMPDLEEATARVIAGPERKSVRISEEEKRVIAFHEAGHALVMKLLPGCERVRRVSVISRGSALGWTLSLPGEDQHLVAVDALRSRLAGIMGGRAAEELVFRKVTSGAENDIQKATTIARRMVTQWGMSERLGTVTMGDNQELVFLGRDLGERRTYSDRTASLIDDEVRREVDAARDAARRILSEHQATLHLVAGRLIAEETVEEDDLDRMVEAGASGHRPLTPVP